MDNSDSEDSLTVQEIANRLKNPPKITIDQDSYSKLESIVQIFQGFNKTSSASAKAKTATELCSSVVEKFGGHVSQSLGSASLCLELSFPASGKISQRFPSNPKSGSLILVIKLFNAALSPKCVWYMYKSVYLAWDKKWNLLSSTQRTPKNSLSDGDFLRSLVKSIEGWAAFAGNLELLLRWLVPASEETQLTGGYVKLSRSYQRLSEAYFGVVLGLQTKLALRVNLQLKDTDIDSETPPKVFAKLLENYSHCTPFQKQTCSHNDQLELQFQEFGSVSKVCQLIQYFADLKSTLDPLEYYHSKIKNLRSLSSEKEQELRVPAINSPSSSKGRCQPADHPSFGMAKVKKNTHSVYRKQVVLPASTSSIKTRKLMLNSYPSAESSVAATSKDIAVDLYSRASVLQLQHFKGKRKSADDPSFEMRKAKKNSQILRNQVVLTAAQKSLLDSGSSADPSIAATSKDMSVHSYSRSYSCCPSIIHQNQPKLQNPAIDLDQLLTSEDLTWEVPYGLEQLNTFIETWEPHGLVTEKSHGFCCWMYFSKFLEWNQVKIRVGGPPPYVHVSTPFLGQDNASFAAFRFQKVVNSPLYHIWYTCLIEANSKYDLSKMTWKKDTFHKSSSDMNWLLTEWAPEILSQMFPPRVKAVEEEETAADDAVAAGLRADWMMGSLETDDTKLDVKVEHDDQFS